MGKYNKEYLSLLERFNNPEYRFAKYISSEEYKFKKVKYYDDNEFVAMIDLDEYIYNTLDSRTVYECIKDLNKDIIVMANHWSTIVNNELKYNINGSPWDRRTKIIYNTKYFFMINKLINII